jgi:hypothetical protein
MQSRDDPANRQRWIGCDETLRAAGGHACRLQSVRAFDQDAIDNKAFAAKIKLTMPVLAVGGEKSFGPTMAEVMRAAATDVTECLIPKSVTG